MNVCFGDTFYFLALLNPRDQAHTRAHEWSAQWRGNILTTAWVITEVADALAASPARALFEPFYHRLLANPQCRIVPFSQPLFAEGVALFGDRPDKQWSLTDCISFIVMREARMTDALTGDHHFQQAGFIPLFQ